jgi:hypothetical protein
MALTPSQSRLEDLRAKEKFAIENEYDYSNPAQGKIQSWVEVELDLTPEEDRLVPPPGRLILNNVDSGRILQKDINAYCAAHPQVCAPASKRDEIYKRMVEEGTQPEPKPAEPVSQDFVPTPMVPPLPTSATHRVIINESNIETVLRSLPDPNAEMVMPLEPEQQLIVLDEAVGPNGTFAEVKTIEAALQSERLYVLRDFIAPQPQTPKSARMDLSVQKSLPMPSAISPRWTDKSVNVSYFDVSDAKVKVSVETNYDSTGGEKLTERMREALAIGLKIILKDNGKKSDEETVNRLLLEDYFIFARAEDYYVDSRAKLPMRVLVTLPYKYIEPLEDKEEEPDFDFSIQIPVAKFLNIFSTASSKIKTLGKGMKEFDGEIQTFDPDRESDNLTSYVDEVEKLLTENGLKGPTSSPSAPPTDFIIIGWKDGYEPTYIAYLDQKSNDKTVMSKWMTAFQKTSPVESKRTQELVHRVREIGSFEGSWTEFLGIFSKEEPVNIVHNNKNLDKQPKSEVGPSVKSVEQMRREDKYLVDDNRKTEIYEERKNKSTVVALAGRAAEDFPKTANQVSSLESSYERVLNNVNLPFLISEAIACLGDIRGLKSDVNSALDFLSQVHKIPSTIFPDDLPTDDISAAFVSTLKNTLEGMISALLISLVKGVLGSLGASCAEKEEPVLDAAPKLEDLLSAMGKIEGDFDRGKAASFIDDLFNVLTPIEICQLLEGNPSEKTLEIAQSLLRRLYPELGFETKSQIVDFFQTLGNFINFQLCRDILDEQIPDTDLTVEDFLCEDKSDSLREELLRQKGEMTEDQIKEQLAKDKERKEQLADQLLAALENGPLADNFKAPDLFCAKGSNKPGAASFVDESFSLMLRETLEGLFGAVSTSFNKEGNEFASTTLEQVQYENEEGQQLFRFEPVPQFKSIIETSIPEQVPDNPTSFTLPVASTPVSNSVAESITSRTIQIENALSLIEEITSGSNENMTSVEFMRDTDSRLSARRGEESNIKSSIQASIENEAFNESIFVTVFGAEQRFTATEELEAELARVEARIKALELAQTNFDFDSREDLRTVSDQLVELLNSGPASGMPTQITYETVGNELTRIVVKRDEGSNDVIIVEQGVPSSYSQYFRANGLEGNSPSDIFASLVRSKFANFVEPDDLETIRENARTTLYSTIKNKFLKDISDRIVSSPYFKKLDKAAHGIELIDLSPQTDNPDCDVHLLKVKTLIKNIEGEFDQDFCLDYDSLDDTTGDQKNPMEAAIMEGCVRLTSRHYLVEMLLKSVFTMSAFDSTRDFDKIKFSFIKDMVKLAMLEYSAQYYDDFLIEAHEIVGAETKEESFIEILKQEYEVIIEPLQIALLLPKTRPSIMREMLQEIIDNTKDNLAGLSNTIESGSSRELIKERIIKIQFEKESLKENDRFFYETIRNPNSNIIPLSPTRQFQLHANSLISRGIATKGEVEKATTIVDSISLIEEAFAEVDYSRMDNYSKERGFFVGLNKEQLRGINSESNNARFIVPISEVENRYEKLVKNKSEELTFQGQEQFSELTFDEFLDATEIKVFFDFFFPIENYKATFTIHEIVSLSTNADIRNSFTITRDQLNSLFYTITPEKDDWKKQNPNLKETSAEDLTSIVDLEFGVKDTPCGELSWNLGLGVDWGKAYKGFNFSFAAKAAKDAALQAFKDYVEQNDPNIKLARQLAFLSKLACVNVPTTVYSAPLSFVPGLFPTPLTNLYNSLGLGFYDKNKTKTDEELEELGLEQRDPCTGELIESLERRQRTGIRDFLTAEAQATERDTQLGRTEEIVSDLREKIELENQRLESAKNQRFALQEDINNYTSYGRRNFDARPYPQELLTENRPGEFLSPFARWTRLSEDERRARIEINRLEAELLQLTR